MNSLFEVIKRESIPSVTWLGQEMAALNGGVLPEVRSGEALRTFLQRASHLSVRWIALANGQELRAHAHPGLSLVIVHSGCGETVGDLCRPIGAGEVVVIPAGCNQGFSGGPDGLQALAIQFGSELRASNRLGVPFPNDNGELQVLFDLSERRLVQFTKRPIFALLGGATLEVPRKRNAFLGSIRIWLDGHTSVLVARRASCRNARFEQVFARALPQGIHGDSREDRRTAGATTCDARMEAFVSWFVYQMYVLNDVEKTAIVHLALEKARSALLSKMPPTLRDLPGSPASEPSEAGAVDLLRCETAKGYLRLQKVVAEAWDMIGAMSDRIVAITSSA